MTMPIIDVVIPQQVLDREQKAALADELTHLLVKFEGLEQTPRRLSTVWVYFNETQADNHTVGGALRLEQQASRYRIFVTVPQGVLTDEAKNGLVSEVTQAILAQEGAEMNVENSLRVYCLITEIDDGNWGTAGRILRRADMAALAKSLG
jgi:phenylpyruvate tautomerase PptA (4-oxalocrotonate tautomerase family)